MDPDLRNRTSADSPDIRHETTDQKAVSRSDGSTVHAVSMTQEEFIAAVRREALESATAETVLQPKGQKPHAALVALWDWFAACCQTQIRISSGMPCGSQLMEPSSASSR